MFFKKELQSELKESGQLTGIDVREMWQIYSRHHNMGYQQFLDRTLNQFQYIVLCRHVEENKIVGFLGVRFDEIHFEGGKNVFMIYYGQTFILPKYRGQSSLKKCLTKIGLKFWLRHPFTKTYIWFDAISYKSYLMMSRYTKRFYPSPDRKTPKDVKQLMNIVGRRRYGDQYNANFGTVSKNHHRLKDFDTRVHPQDLKDKHIRFYAERNPGHIKGDGLLCMFPNTIANYAYTFKKLLIKQLKHIIPVPVLQPIQESSGKKLVKTS